MRFLRRLVNLAAAAAVLAALLALGFVATRGRPQDLPWTGFDLGQPIGRTTRFKLGALARDAPGCRALLADAGVALRPLPPRIEGAACGYRDGVAWTSGGSRAARYAPAAPTLACPLAAALALWEWRVVQPAAVARFGQTVAAIEHYGSYACRPIDHREGARWSAHATATAFDVAGFRLADGRRITVAGAWRSAGAEGAFLHDVRDGGCRLFAVTLSPDYNAAHRDHLHLEQRAGIGWSLCR